MYSNDSKPRVTHSFRTYVGIDRATLRQAALFLVEGYSVPDRYVLPLAALALERLDQLQAEEASPEAA